MNWRSEPTTKSPPIPLFSTTKQSVNNHPITKQPPPDPPQTDQNLHTFFRRNHSGPTSSKLAQPTKFQTATNDPRETQQPPQQAQSSMPISPLANNNSGDT
uniref:Putative ovule protein n=1 Tax=Solanum chacoense TaxID=4108 RepID=A0A0V0HPD8_SOLCH